MNREKIIELLKMYEKQIDETNEMLAQMEIDAKEINQILEKICAKIKKYYGHTIS